MRILLVAAALLAAPLASAGLVVTAPSNGDVVGPDFVVEGRFEDPGASGEQAALPHADISRLVASREFQDARARLAALPGFLELAPSLEEPVVHAVFTGPAPPVLPVTQVDGRPVIAYGGAAPQRLRMEVAQVRDVSPPPGTAEGIRPGSHLFIDFPGESGLYACTANFVWRDHENRKLYLGAAGHCFLPGDKTASHGSGADYDVSGVGVEVCVAQCQFGGQLGFSFQGSLEDLGPVAYARQTGGGGDVGNDFGIVEIPEPLWDLVDPAMAVWGGPDDVSSVGIGTPIAHYGNGFAVAETFATMARLGVGLGSDQDSWTTAQPSNSGDSGSAINVATPSGADIRGGAALGILTHGVGVGVAIPSIAYGTTMSRAVAMAKQADINIEPALEGEDIPGFADAVPQPPVDLRASPGDGEVRLAWSPSPEGAEATGYVVRYGEVAGGPYTQEAVAQGSQTTISGLANDSTYYFVVHARSDAGESGPSEEASATPTAGASPPSSPRGLTALAGEGTVDLSWDAPADDGGKPVKDYIVRWRSDGGGFTHSQRADQTSATIDGLRGGRPYTFVVHARNEAGEGPASNEVEATPFAPAQPARVVEVRIDDGPWERAQEWDGEAFRHSVRGAPPGDHAVEVQIMQDGERVASSTMDVVVTGDAADVEDESGKASPGLPLLFGAAALVAVAAGQRRRR